MPTDAATLRRQAEERARKIVAGTLCPDSGWYNSPDDLCAVIATALLRAEAKGMRDAKEIASGWATSKSCGCGGDPCAHIRLAVTIMELCDRELRAIEEAAK